MIGKIVEGYWAWRSRRTLRIAPSRRSGQPPVDHRTWPTPQLDLYDRAHTMLLEARKAVSAAEIDSFEAMADSKVSILLRMRRARTHSIETQITASRIALTVTARNSTPLEIIFPHDGDVGSGIGAGMAKAISGIVLDAAADRLDSAHLSTMEDRSEAERILSVHLHRLVAEGHCLPDSVASVYDRNDARSARSLNVSGRKADGSFASNQWENEDRSPIIPPADHLWEVNLHRGPSYSNDANGTVRIQVAIGRPSVSAKAVRDVDPVEMLRIVRDPSIPRLVDVTYRPEA